MDKEDTMLSKAVVSPTSREKDSVDGGIAVNFRVQAANASDYRLSCRLLT